MSAKAIANNLKRLAQWGVWTTLLVVSIPLLIVSGIAWSFAVVTVHIAAWLRGFGRPWVVMVYSDSPKWKAHVEEQLIPSLAAPVSILNLSRRAQWGDFSLGRYAFRLFAGRREYCPLALVFLPGKPVRTFRFYRPFVEAKDGRLDQLRLLEAELEAFLDGFL